MKLIKEWAGLVFFLAIATIFVGLTLSSIANAQMPPDSPFGPDPDRPPFLPYTQQVDFNLPPDTCVEEIIVKRATGLNMYCSKEIPTERGPDGQAIYVALPPDCMMILITQEKRNFEDGTLGFVENYEYHRNPDCWILFKNIRYMKTEENLQGI